MFYMGIFVLIVIRRISENVCRRRPVFKIGRVEDRRQSTARALQWPASRRVVRSALRAALAYTPDLLPNALSKYLTVHL